MVSEAYHPRKAMRWMLGRIMALNLLSLYALIFALFGKTHDMIAQLNSYQVADGLRHDRLVKQETKGLRYARPAQQEPYVA
jgi:hypothetical protein